MTLINSPHARSTPSNPGWTPTVPHDHSDIQVYRLPSFPKGSARAYGPRRASRCWWRILLQGLL
ncbi:hypothetical protein [Deinococcus fonticola]|uniref:hypothetical protein n=1 Tax=Deinococcus fonticola TaxID=2528713 RepID=UPI001074D9B3|nr:hypothetical protein [Deinococcus fonticola]